MSATVGVACAPGPDSAGGGDPAPGAVGACASSDAAAARRDRAQARRHRRATARLVAARRVRRVRSSLAVVNDQHEPGQACRGRAPAPRPRSAWRSRSSRSNASSRHRRATAPVARSLNADRLMWAEFQPSAADEKIQAHRRDVRRGGRASRPAAHGGPSPTSRRRVPARRISSIAPRMVRADRHERKRLSEAREDAGGCADQAGATLPVLLLHRSSGSATRPLDAPPAGGRRLTASRSRSARRSRCQRNAPAQPQTGGAGAHALRPRAASSCVAAASSRRRLVLTPGLTATAQLPPFDHGWAPLSRRADRLSEAHPRRRHRCLQRPPGRPRRQRLVAASAAARARAIRDTRRPSSARPAPPVQTFGPTAGRRAAAGSATTRLRDGLGAGRRTPESEPTHASCRRSAAGSATEYGCCSPTPTARSERTCASRGAFGSSLTFPDSEADRLGDAGSPTRSRPSLSGPVLSGPILLPAPPRRGLALVGLAMGLAIVGVAVAGVKLLGGTKTTPASVSTRAAAAPAETPPVIAAIEPTPAPSIPAARTAPPPPGPSPCPPRHRLRRRPSPCPPRHHRRRPRPCPQPSLMSLPRRAPPRRSRTVAPQAAKAASGISATRRGRGRSP